MTGFARRLLRQRQRRLAAPHGAPLLSSVWRAQDDGSIACFTELFLPDMGKAQALRCLLATIDGASVELRREGAQVALRILTSGNESTEAVYNLISEELQLKGGIR